MKLNFKIQDEELNLAKSIDDEMNKKPKKVYMFIGTLKESGFDIIEESIIDTKAKITLFMGIDKKNTTKGLLDGLLKYTKDIYVYNNNDLKEFSSNIYIFEFEKTVSIYLVSSNMSENGLTKDISVFSKVEYNLNDENDKKEYKENLKKLTEVKKLEFVKLDKNIIKTLLDEKIIFSNKQYEHNVKSISEFLGKRKVEIKKDSEDNSKIEEDISSSNFNIPVIDLSNSNLDIDISDAVEYEMDSIEEKKEEKKEEKVEDKKKIKQDFKKNEISDLKLEEVEELDDKDHEFFNGVVDLNDMLLTKSKVKLNKNKPEVVEEEKEEKETVLFKKLDLNNISNYIFELPAKQQNGQDSDVIKIPNYIKDLIPNFFEFSEKAKSKVINGSHYKVRDIQVEIVNAETGTKTFDSNAKMMQKKRSNLYNNYE